MAQRNQRGMTTVRASVFRLERLNLTVPSQDMHRVSSALVTAATVPLALGLAGDVYVVITKIVGLPTAGFIAGSLSLFFLIGLWHAYPLIAAYLRNHTEP